MGRGRGVSKVLLCWAAATHVNYPEVVKTDIARYAPHDDNAVLFTKLLQEQRGKIISALGNEYYSYYND